ncbi:ATP synthase F1 subunit delta [Clostridium sp. 'deep sea']|uniref:ATP synthase F1 subunit delta n=1 Tax=Clostridium sp. 'deep sea' TaxID=2779445 RepID=UPI00189669E8|nr:ATP synthase F1 subunit delta [Clostridium sp. 'deep sea']QOR33781.1 ATP synthase F1 subunit delta [Clostridium sp. 'deep sea']
MKNSQVASRYSKAIFELAIEKKQVEEINSDLQAVADLLKSEPELAIIFFHPRLSKEEKTGLVNEVFKSVVNTDYVINFLYLTIAKKREKDIPAICMEFNSLYDSYKRQLPVEIISAYDIDKKQLNSILAKITKRTGREPLPTVKIDKEILGGIIIKYEDKIIDGSVRKQLQQLADSIKAIPVAGLRGEVI